MERFTGIIGIAVILGICYLMSNNRKAISKKTVFTGLTLQLGLAIFVLKVPLGQAIVGKIGLFINKILEFANAGGNFVFGFLNNSPQKVFELFGSGPVFAIQLTITIILVLALANIMYYYGIMQRVIAFFAKIMSKFMNVSGSEAVSNIASAFVGQVEAQILIRPYLATLTKSELLASMTGSMACIAGGVMAIYISMGIPAKFLLAASIMAAPGALVVAKIVFPETEQSQTKDSVKVEIKKTHINLIDAIAHGASDGFKVSMNVIAMLVALLALVAMIDWILGGIGSFMFHKLHWSLSFIDIEHLNLKSILGAAFSLFALVMGVPLNEIQTVGALMGTKLVLNEFIAYMNLSALTLSPKAMAIASFALCGFANLGSIAIQIGGIGELEPTKRKELAQFGFKALICGTFASYISACIAGILL